MRIMIVLANIGNLVHAASAGGRRPIRHETAEAGTSEITVRPSLRV
jgi:hypothetical protein